MTAMSINQRDNYLRYHIQHIDKNLRVLSIQEDTSHRFGTADNFYPDLIINLLYKGYQLVIKRVTSSYMRDSGRTQFNFSLEEYNVPINSTSFIKPCVTYVVVEDSALKEYKDLEASMFTQAIENLLRASNLKDVYIG